MQPPDGRLFYTQEAPFIRWCMYITKHLPYLPTEMWILIFKKALMSEPEYWFEFWCWDKYKKLGKPCPIWNYGHTCDEVPYILDGW